MSANIGALVDRVFREYLEPADELNSYTAVASTLSSSATTLSFDASLLTQEEEDIMDSGSVIEIGQELMYCTSLDTVNNFVTVVRGVRGTTAAEHTTGKIVKIAPAFTRLAVFNAIIDQINNLFPTLFAVETKTMTASTGYTLVADYSSPGDANYLVSILSAISQFTDFSAGSDTTGVNFAPVTCSLVELPNPFVYNDADGVERTVTYTTGPSVVHAVQFAGVAAQMMSGRDIPSATSQYITEQMSISGYPIGSSNSIRNSLLQYQQLLLNQARKYLRAKYPESVSVDGLVYGIQA